jgi:hypothetical protein
VEPSAGTTELTGEKAGVSPLAIPADGTVLGTANTLECKSVADRDTGSTVKTARSDNILVKARVELQRGS